MADNDDMAELACELFKTFAQFEYCLKVTGYCVADRAGNAKPNWEAFAKALPFSLKESEDPAVKAAVSYIFEAPPRKQVFEGGVLQWREAAPQTDNENDLILQYVRRVRNNLFHGGKFNGHFFDPERSRELLKHAISILTACILQSPKMLEAYEHKAE